MLPIKKLNELVNRVKNLPPKKIVVANAQDPNTIAALLKSVDEGFITPILIGDKTKITQQLNKHNRNSNEFDLINIKDDSVVARESVRLVKEGQADILMKGLISTGKFLKAVLTKGKGLLPPKTVMSYTCAVELPKYHKLLFISDTAVLPFPNQKEKIAMVKYSVEMAKKFGIEKPKVALIGSSEKVNEKFPNSIDYAVISKMAQRGQIKDCVIDGPLDVFSACDKEAAEIKGIESPVAGDADILIFPSLESCNAFYKGLMLFAQGELAGMIEGTEKPVVVMSRSESEISKFYCIALSCLMAND